MPMQLLPIQVFQCQCFRFCLPRFISVIAPYGCACGYFCSMTTHILLWWPLRKKQKHKHWELHSNSKNWKHWKVKTQKTKRNLTHKKSESTNIKKKKINRIGCIFISCLGFCYCMCYVLKIVMFTIRQLYTKSYKSYISIHKPSM